MAVDCGVEAYGEDVLMILGKCAWCNDVAVWRCFAFVDVDNGDNAGSSGLDCNAEKGQCVP